MNRAFGIFFLVLAITLVGLLPVHAQLDVSQDAVTISLNPQYPKPYSIVTVTPGSTSIDLSASTVTVSANGKLVQKSTGTASAQIAVGGPGTKTTVAVTAVNNGQTYTQQLVIHPADVSLITEPRSITHPFYLGAPLVGAQSHIRLVAVPDLESSPGKPLAASSLVYTWKFGDQILQSDSGIGKSVLNAIAPVRYRDAAITVTVTTPDDSLVAQAQTTISPTDPYLRIYQNDPLLGPEFDTALPSEVSMTENETTFRAVPYYFSSFPTLEWDVNGTQSGADQDITVRSNGNGQGTAVLGVSGQESDTAQSAESTMSVHFGNAKTLGVFGL